MAVSENGTVRPRRPQLNESIERLDEMIDGLAVAIPGAVADALREALGPAFAAAIKDAVTAAVAEALRGVAPAPTGPALPVPPAPPAPAPRPMGRAWIKVKAAIHRLRRWAARAAAPVLAHAALGWAVAKVIGAATVRSRAAAVVTALAGTFAGLIGFAAGPVGASVLLALTAGWVTAIAMWVAPTARLCAALRDDWSAGSQDL